MAVKTGGPSPELNQPPQEILDATLMALGQAFDQNVHCAAVMDDGTQLLAAEFAALRSLYATEADERLRLELVDFADGDERYYFFNLQHFDSMGEETMDAEYGTYRHGASVEEIDNYDPNISRRFYEILEDLSGRPTSPYTLEHAQFTPLPEFLNERRRQQLQDRVAKPASNPGWWRKFFRGTRN